MLDSKSGEIGVPTDLALHGHVLMPHVSCITEYKGKLDATLVATALKRSTPEQRAWLLTEGFVKHELFGTGVNPQTFASWVLGPFRIDAPIKEQRQTSVFPGWAAIGWNRRQYGGVSLDQARAIKSSLDKSTMDPSVSDGYATWLKPIPVIVAGEGKHRVDLHRQHCLDMVARIQIDEFPPAAELELFRIHGSGGVWGLRCLRMDRIRKTGRVQGALAYLPLPNLSVPLLKAYGVQISERRYWPWQISLGLDDAPLGLRLRPGKWRSVVLSNGYV